MKIAFVASPEPGGQNALKELSDGYGQAAVAEAEFIVALGGDHMALEALHDAVAMPAKPVYPMRIDSSAGVLCNSTFHLLRVSPCPRSCLDTPTPPRLRHDRPNGEGDDP